MRPAELMRQLGWIGPDVWWAHAIWLSDEEIAALVARLNVPDQDTLYDLLNAELESKFREFLQNIQDYFDSYIHICLFYYIKYTCTNVKMSKIQPKIRSAFQNLSLMNSYNDYQMVKSHNQNIFLQRPTACDAGF
jgi:hypothetical protein